MKGERMALAVVFVLLLGCMYISFLLGGFYREIKDYGIIATKDAEIASLTKVLAEKEANKKPKMVLTDLTQSTEAVSTEHIRVESLTMESYTINVKNRTLEEAINAGNYNFVDWLSLVRFESEPLIVGEKIAMLIHFNYHISPEVAITEIASMGFRPANIWEHLAFGEKYPEILRDGPIVSLGSFFKFNNMIASPFLCDYDDDKLSSVCGTQYWVYKWPTHYRFLATRN